MADDLTPGEWTITVDPCPCVCDPTAPPVVVYWRSSLGGEFVPWDGGTSSYAPSSAEGNTVDVRFAYAGDGTPRKMRYRFVTAVQDSMGVFHYTLSADFLVTDPAGTGLLTAGGLDFVTIPEPPMGSDGYVSVAGAAQAPTPNVTRFIREWTLRKKGFAPYRGLTGDDAKYYRTESVVLGGSGSQTFTGTTYDPAATYTNTLNAELNAAGYASSPINDPRISKTFGTVVNSLTLRTMTAGANVLRLQLSDEYATDDLQAAVQASLDLQAGGGGTSQEGSGLAANHRLTRGESYLSRRESRVTINVGLAHAYADPGSFPIQVRWKERTTDFLTSAVTDADRSQTFALNVIASADLPIGRDVSADFDFVFDSVAAENTQIELVEFEADAQSFFSNPPFLEYLET